MKRESYRAILKEKKLKGLVGPQELEFLGDKLIVKDSFSRTEWMSGFIVDYKQNDDYLYMYTSAASAIIVPRNVFESLEEENKFHVEVERFIDKGEKTDVEH